MRRSMLFWNQWILQRATIPSWYLQGFFTLPAFRNSFQGALPPMVSLSFLWASSSPPNIDGPASTAIWANCWVGNDSGNLTTSPNFSVSSILFSNSLWVGGVSTSGTWESVSAGGSCSEYTCTLVLTCRAFLPSPILGIFLVLAILKKKTSQSKARAALWESCDICFELIGAFQNFMSFAAEFAHCLFCHAFHQEICQRSVVNMQNF